ncbi:hypothetical protein PP635_gp25 [Arthrobacter phage Auxilium]|uniref:Uncharacterized protein n=2 Tax=Richievirus TaxID=3044803 RepID=A0A3G2KIP9_9CAUD|nr:hypothetical protein PP634_gp25 [Arthrobacter phage Richie]YP_010655844.1 hypothetical protein PP635_gp25 [Arthrobacter phage Auxilium]UYL86582.1 membrane protein [Arthrobacter phage RadFad]WNM64512.1 membrane protein [Arthrobacter phage MidnightRain]AYN55804.1 hypothetical protein PBI_AUXILIUM_25 [Arthrobacter phage Auxilium]AYN58851.1 hypothetical protein PBI_RICHIE_25 [Arthrobacter phage Richie]
MTQLLQQASPWIVALIAGAFAVYTAKIQHKGRPEHALIDQLQEEVASLRTGRDTEIALMKKDISDLKTEQDKSKRRERIRDDYINKLRRHIEEGKPPPAPEWPAGLYD